MKPQATDKTNEGKSFRRWITATTEQLMKPFLLVSGAVFICILLTSIQDMRNRLDTVQKKMDKHSAGIAKLAFLNSPMNLDAASIRFEAIQCDATPPVDLIDITGESAASCADVVAKESDPGTAQQEAAAKKKADTATESVEAKPAVVTPSPTRKSPQASHKTKQKSSGQQHFGVGLKLSI